MKAKILMVLIVLALASLACSTGSTTATSTPSSSNSSSNSSGNTSQFQVTQIASSQYIDKVVMATNTQGDAKDPVGLTDSFDSQAVVHAVVAIKDAPANTKFTAAWYVVDIGSSQNGQLIDKTDLTTEGTRNLDFTLSPTKPWPSGSYRVEILVNDKATEDVMWFVK